MGEQRCEFVDELGRRCGMAAPHFGDIHWVEGSTHLVGWLGDYYPDPVAQPEPPR